jgi:hypothetical protein
MRYFFTARYLWQLPRDEEWRVSSLQILINTAQCSAYDITQQPPGLPPREGMSPEHALYPGPSLTSRKAHRDDRNTSAATCSSVPVWQV